jgi:Tol biopolymer transport system component
MKIAASIAVVAATAAVVPAGSGGAGGQAQIVFRTVHLAMPKRPPALYSALPSGTSRRLLARGAEQPAWSPNRQRVAFSGGGVLGLEGIWVMNADGSSRRRLTRTAGDGDPSWSPDGLRIAFRRATPNNFDLWVVPTAGGATRPLLQTPRANELDPDWSPDGRRLAFQSSRCGSIQIWVLDLRSKVARRLTRGRPAFSPDWSPDGRRIAPSLRQDGSR